MQKKSMNSPDETRTFDKGKVDLTKIGPYPPIGQNINIDESYCGPQCKLLADLHD